MEKGNGLGIMHGIEELLYEIPNEYRAVPFWSWNDKLEPEELRRQIRWMKDMGLGGFFMHARGGLKTPYMSDEWMECVSVCCDEAEKLQMDAWGYDENGWPSGFAGGKLLEDEKNRERYLLHQIGAYDENADVSYIIEENTLTRVGNGLQDGEYLNLYIKISVSTVDILNPEVVRQFIGLTHEQYKAYFGEQFSSKFRGFFTDEPQFYRGGGTPYSPMVAKYFKEQYNEDIMDTLGLLFVKKEGYCSFRYRYWLAMQRLMIDSFAKSIYQWCEDNQVGFTGHYIEENTLGNQLMCCGGIMPFYEYMHTPGIDWLGTDTIFEIGPHQVGSVARQLGKKHVMTETFAGCGWNATPQELRRIAGYQYANGVNFMCHHLVPYSEHGQRKRDYPVHFTTVNPWVRDDFKKFNDYFTKLGYLLATGEEPVKVAILHPIRSAYLEFQQAGTDPEFGIKDLEDGLRSVCRMFSSRGIPYHFLDETILEEHGFVTGEQIGCGECTYDYLVLPPIYTMGKHTEKLLKTYVEKGGKVLLVDAVPTYVEGEPYAYEYLQSNITLQEIVEVHDFQVENTDNDLYYAYRIFQGKPVIFIQNVSKEKTYLQSFKFKEKYSSFVKLNLDTMDTEVVPLDITARESESLLLFPSYEMASQNELEEVELVFHDAKVQFEENYLPIDTVRYSKDGVQYSEPIYVNTLFQNLLRERYDGKLWLKYDFTVKEIPKSLYLLAERDNTKECKVNGHSIRFAAEWEEDTSFLLADISKYVQLGVNSYEVNMDWHQGEDTYYALFGENVTETLKNCIAYESEIEAVYLKGKFGVYSDSSFERHDKQTLCGSGFYIGRVPEQVSDLVTDGFPFLRNKVKLTQKCNLEQKNVSFHVKGDFLSAKVWVNEQYAGQLFFDKQIDISSYATEGDNRIDVEFTIGNRNLFGPLHKDGAEWFILPSDFDRCDIVQNKCGSMSYKLNCFYVKER